MNNKLENSGKSEEPMNAQTNQSSDVQANTETSSKGSNRREPATIKGSDIGMISPSVGFATPTMQKAQDSTYKGNEHVGVSPQLGPTIDQARRRKLRLAAENRKKGKNGIIIMSIVLLVFLLMMPTLFASMKRAYFRKHPDKYYVDSIVNGMHDHAKTHEISLEIDHDSSLNEIVSDDIVNNIRLVVTHSRFVSDAKGSDPIVRYTNQLLYKDAEILQFDVAQSEDRIRFDFPAGNVVLELAGKDSLSVGRFWQYVSEEERENIIAKWEAVKKDNEVREIVLGMCADVVLEKKDFSDEKSGYKCDVLRNEFTLKGIYHGVYDLVQLVDSNDVLNDCARDGLLLVLDHPQFMKAMEEYESQYSEGEHSEIMQVTNVLRVAIESGVFVQTVQEVFESMELYAEKAFDVFNPRLIQTLYVTEFGVVRMQNDLYCEIPVMFGKDAGVQIHVDSYDARMEVGESVVSDANSIILHAEDLERENFPRENEQKQLEKLLVDSLQGSEGLKKLVEDMVLKNSGFVDSDTYREFKKRFGIDF